MKKVIVILGSIILGIFIFGLILGDEPDTLKSSVKGVMQELIEQQKTTP